MKGPYSSNLGAQKRISSSFNWYGTSFKDEKNLYFAADLRDDSWGSRFRISLIAIDRDIMEEASERR